MLFKNTSHYMLASLVTAFLGLLSTFALTRVLSPGEYGIYIVGVSAGGVASSVLFTWLRLSVLRFQAEGGPVDIRATVLAGYGFSTALSPLVLLVVSFTIGLSSARAMAIAGFVAALGVFELGQELLKARLQTGPYVVAAALRSLLAFDLCLGSALLGGGGVGQIAMSGVAFFIAALAVTPDVWRPPIAKPDFALLKTLLGYGLPLTASGFVYATHIGLDRLAVAFLLGAHSAGLYGASADLIRQMILIPAGSVAAASIPLAIRAYAGQDDKGAREHLSVSFELLLAVLTPSAVGLALTMQDIAEIVLGRDFRGTSTMLVPFFALAWLFQSISQFYIHVSFHLAKRPYLGLAQGLATLLVNLVLVAPLTLAFKMEGAAVAFLAAEGVGMAIGIVLTRRAYRIPVEAGPILRVGLAAGFMAATLLLADKFFLSDHNVVSFAARVALGVAAYGAAALAVNVARLRDIALKRLRRSTPRTARGARIEKQALADEVFALADDPR